MICALVFGILLIPGSAAAWGPITHLAHGADVLTNLSILGAGLQRLLNHHRLDYLYGCVGADITVGKKYTHAVQAHCHGWRVGWQILEHAESPAQRAFAWGYLTHLSADVLSHNHFVPTQLIVSYRSRALRHIYWETRFDTMQPLRYRKLISQIRGHEFRECDALVKHVVERTLFSFRTNKRIFNSVLAFQDWHNWHQLVAGVSARSRHTLSRRLVTRYNHACHLTIIDLLRHRKHARCQNEDPTGYEALRQAKATRATLKTLYQRRALTPELKRQLAELDRRADLDLNVAATVAGHSRALPR